MNLACRTRSSRSKYRNREARTRCRQSQVSCRTTRPFATQIGRSSVRCGPTLVSFLQNKAKNINDFRDLLPKPSLTLRLRTNLQSGAR